MTKLTPDKQPAPILGMFLHNRSITHCSDGTVIEAMSNYSLTWDEREQKYIVLPITTKD